MSKTKAEQKLEKQEERNVLKTAFITELIAAGIAVLTALLYLFGVISDKFEPMYIMGPAMAVMLGGHGVREWKGRKLLALASFILGLLLIAVTIKKIFA